MPEFYELKTVYFEKLLAFRRAISYKQFPSIALYSCCFGFQACSETREFTIVLFEHDGFSLHFPRTDEMWLPRIANIVQEEIARYGVETKLEW